MNIRELSKNDIPLASEVLTSAGLGGVTPSSLAWYMNGDVKFLGAFDGDESLVGTSMAYVSDEQTGWLANIAVLPHARFNGLGSRLSKAALDWLMSRGLSYMRLFATDLGRPVYEKLGFLATGCNVVLERQPTGKSGAVAEGTPEPEAVVQGTTDPEAATGVASEPTPRGWTMEYLTPGQLTEQLWASICHLDTLASGETRHNMLQRLGGPVCLIKDAEGALVAFHLDGPFGSGCGPTIARDAQAGALCLQEVARRLVVDYPDTSVQFRVPEENRVACDTLVAHGFKPVRKVTRMAYQGRVAESALEMTFSYTSGAIG